MNDAAHALYPPSGASRWIPCNGSVRTPAPPQETNDAAKFGTEVHEWLASAKDVTWQDENGVTIFTGVVPLQPTHWTPEQRANANRCFADWFNHTPTDHQSEVRLHSKRWPELLFGTVDALWFDSPKVACLNDLKTGLKSVSAVNNLQMKVYAYLVYCQFEDVETFNTKIVQPLRNYVGTHTYTREEIAAFETEIANAIESGTSFAPGDWCLYCPLRNGCSTLHTTLLSLIEDAKKLNLVQATAV